jgi:hypothetical protein
MTLTGWMPTAPSRSRTVARARPSATLTIAPVPAGPGGADEIAVDPAEAPAGSSIDARADAHAARITMAHVVRRRQIVGMIDTTLLAAGDLQARKSSETYMNVG